MTTITRPPSFIDFSLDDKYTLEEGRIYLTGVQALVRLPLDQHRADRRAGLHTATFISGYRGSPLGAFDMELDRNRKLLDAHHVVHQPGLNEELAATALLGSQSAALFPGPRYDGVLGMWYGKGPGVDRSGDAFKHANHAGTGRNGGVLALGGDDPSSKSSTLPSASEVAFYDAMMPVLYPGSSQEILDLGLHGFMLSRTAGLWVGCKIVTNVADGAGTAEVGPERVRPVIPTVELDGRPFEHRLDWRLLAPNNLEMERTLHTARIELARRYAWENRLNPIVVDTSDAWLGILAAGKTWYDVRQALDEMGLDEEALRRYGVRLLKMGMLFPMEPRVIREFARGLQEILVVEEKRPFLEMFAKETLYSAPDRPVITGKLDDEGRALLPANSELDPDLIARAIAARLGRRVQIPSVEARIAYLDGATLRPIPLTLTTQRTAYYCSGCPHNRSTVIPEGSIVAAGIGCHSMALWMDPDTYGQITGITQMGGEGAQWVGAAPFTDTKHIFQNIGDGTLFHSGGLALNFAVASGANITYKILYNSAVAMTGGQEAVGTLPIPALTRRLAAEGIKRIIITTEDADRYRGVPLAAIAEVRHRDGIIAAQAELAATPGVTVLIHDQQCAAEKRRLRKRGRLVDPTTRVFINERVCEGCGDCGRKSNCLSVQPVETEFGRKTQIHQSSCNKDYSCLLGDCPSFVTVEPARGRGRGPGVRGQRGLRVSTPGLSLPARLRSRPSSGGEGADSAGSQVAPPRPPAPDPRPLPSLAEPEPRVPSGAFSVHMMGIGGTGVVTVSQILGTAALLDGRQVWGLDQTGLSQKGGPVVSDVKLSALPDAAPVEVVSASDAEQGAVSSLNGYDIEAAPERLFGARTQQTAKVTAGGADLYLGFDLLVAAGRDNLAKADAGRTVAVISTSQIPTGQMVVDTAARFPRLADVTEAIDAVTRADCNVYLDAQALSAALFGDHMPANLLLLGAAYQAGVLPLSGEAIERAIRLNGAAVETNLAAFRWGRAAVADPAYVGRVVRSATGSELVASKPTAEARRLIESAGAEGELRRQLDVRVPDLIAYQNTAYARTYVEFVGRVRLVEQAKSLGRTEISEAVARNLYKLMAYKDEYEVARLHLDAAEQAKLARAFDGDVEVTWNLHPPMLRALGLKQKIKLGPWFTPAMQALRDTKRVRGTPLDPFGYAEVRRVERALIPEYRQMVAAALRKLSPANHADVVALAELPDMVRGYEQIKLENVRQYREKAQEMMARL